jgi:hypothetical protein
MSEQNATNAIFQFCDRAREIHVKTNTGTGEHFVDYGFGKTVGISAEFDSSCKTALYDFSTDEVYNNCTTNLAIALNDCMISYSHVI